MIHVTRGTKYASFSLLVIIGTAIGITWAPWYLSKPIALGPWLSWTDDPHTTITISWWTEPAINGYVIVSNATWSGRFNSSDPHYHHVLITNLTPGCKYTYFINASELDLTSLHGEFMTISDNVDSIKFIVYGDNRASIASSAHYRVLSAMSHEKNVSFIINVGDIVLGGAVWADWKRFLSETSTIARNIPYIIAAGNHELEGSYIGGSDNGRMFRKLIVFPGDNGSYVFHIANISLIVFACNTSHTPLPEAQLKWLNETLASITGWKFVFFHVPVTSTWGNVSINPMHAELEKILIENNVDVVFQGHDHAYARWKKDNTTFIITAGGGAEPDPAFLWDGPSDTAYHYIRVIVSGNTATFTVVRPDGSVIDSFFLQR